MTTLIVGLVTWFSSDWWAFVERENGERLNKFKFTLPEQILISTFVGTAWAILPSLVYLAAWAVYDCFGQDRLDKKSR